MGKIKLPLKAFKPRIGDQRRRRSRLKENMRKRSGRKSWKTKFRKIEIV